MHTLRHALHATLQLFDTSTYNTTFNTKGEVGRLALAVLPVHYSAKYHNPSLDANTVNTIGACFFVSHRQRKKARRDASTVCGVFHCLTGKISGSNYGGVSNIQATVVGAGDRLEERPKPDPIRKRYGCEIRFSSSVTLMKKEQYDTASSEKKRP